jgi:hypothetical protein
VKIVKNSVVLAMMISFMTTALSSPFEEVPAPGGRPFLEADLFEPLPPNGDTAGPRHEYESLGNGRPPGGPFRAEGVALERGETYFLHIWLIDTKQIPPALARDLLKENRSLDEIREEISKSEGNTTTRGGMILGDNRYILVNIDQTFDGNSSVLKTDLVEFDYMPRSAEGRVTGHIAVNTHEVNGVQVGEGNLTLNDDGESMSYRLTFVPPQPEMDQNGEPSGGNPWPW